MEAGDEKSWLTRGVVVTVVGGLLLGGIQQFLKAGGGDIEQPLEAGVEAVHPVFEGGQPVVGGIGPTENRKPDGNAGQERHEAAKPTVFCDTHSFYSMKDYIRIENDQFQCKHCGAVGVVVNDPADGSMAFKFKPNQTPRKLLSSD